MDLFYRIKIKISARSPLTEPPSPNLSWLLTHGSDTGYTTLKAWIVLDIACKANR